MQASPALAFAAGAATRLRDLNGDGLDDLVQIRPDAVREFRGFRSARATEEGEPGSPTSITETTFLLGECEADAADASGLPSPCTSQGAWRANPREALKGLPLVTSKRDEAGRVLSTDHTTYRLRRLYAGLDGRDVHHAFAERTTRLLYDTAGFAPVPIDVPVVDVDVEVSGSSAPVAGVVKAAATYARVETATEMDLFGNATTATDLGCVEGCDAADEAIATTHVTSRPARGLGTCA
jgi:hypothetical protein